MLAVLVTAAVVAVGCSDPDPTEELAAAIDATADTPVTFEFGVRAERGGLPALGDGAAAAAFLDDAGIDGARDPDGALQLAVTIGGDTPVLEVVAPCVTCRGDGPDAGSVLLRTGFAELLPVGDLDPAEQLDPILADLGVDAAGRRALVVSFAGGWIEVTGLDGLGDLLGNAADGNAADGNDGGEAAREATEVTLAEVLGTVTVTEARDAGDVRRLEVELAVADLLALFGTGSAAAEAVPGTVVLRDGLIQEVRVELSPVSETSDAAVALVLTVAPATGEVAVERPEPAVTLTAEQLFTLTEALQEALGSVLPDRR